MCGIFGVIAHSSEYRFLLENATALNNYQFHRGPDNEGVYNHKNVCLAHRRLSIIDVSDAASQPFTDASGRFTVVYNGEFFSFKKWRNELIAKGYKFVSNSDTEVILHLFILEGASFIKKLDGFFSLAIYDNLKNEVFIARDRFGIKPLYYSFCKDYLIFSSELKPIIYSGIPLSLDHNSLFSFFQLSYIPAPHSIFNEVKKMPVSSYCFISTEKINQKNIDFVKYYNIPEPKENTELDYNRTCSVLKEKIIQSVNKSLISDVPIGAFLSGGVDSSIIVSVAAKQTSGLKTFSVGYQDESFFNETKYANIVAKKYRTEHHAFSLTREDLCNTITEILNCIDEPFGDSSSIPVHWLCKETRKYVTVALSGDGADEIFAGYNKYYAEYQYKKRPILNSLIKFSKPLWKNIPSSRNSYFGNKIRQINRYYEGISLDNKERYWRWCSIMNDADINKLIHKKNNSDNLIKAELLKGWHPDGDINQILKKDVELVLQNDMLVKVDRMSMANSLEVRPPFLDQEIVDLAFSYPESYKIDGKTRKKILIDAFKEDLPVEVYNRPKHGFEVPLLHIFRNEMDAYIQKEIMNSDFLLGQNIFCKEQIHQLIEKMHSNNPEDSVSIIWNLIVFQNWYKKYSEHFSIL